MRGLKRLTARAAGVWLGCVIGGGLLATTPGWAKEILFVARDLEDQQAVWLPKEVVLHRTTDFLEPLIFRFDNPTARTHIFEAPGLLESVEEDGVQIVKPVRVTIAPEESEKIVLDRNQITSDVLTEGRTVAYRFYCPLHRADDDMGGSIIIKNY